MATKILLVEDDPNAGILLKGFLESEGFEVRLCGTSKSGLQAFLSDPFVLCLLDGSLPDYDGFQLAREIRSRNSLVPILFITARGLLDDKIRGFQSGADDYITKPFEPFELVFKIKAILRRVQQTHSPADPCFQLGRYAFDPEKQTLEVNGNIRRITARENEILKILSLKKNQIVRKEDILLALWGESDYFKGRSLDVFIAKLRKYLSDDPTITIENIHGVGFALAEKKQ